MKTGLSTPRGRRATLLLLAIALFGGCDSSSDPAALDEEDAPTICPPLGALSVPETVSGTLESASECVLNGKSVDVWALDVTRSGELTIDLTSEEFDPVLTLLDTDARVIRTDDDGGYGFNSRIHMELTRGRYYLYATSFDGYYWGNYRLAVYEGPPSSPCPPSSTLAFPDTVQGAITSSAACNFNGYYVDVWRLELPADTTVTLILESDEFDPTIAIADPGGSIIDHSSAADDIAALDVSLVAGSYDIWVVDAYTPGSTGRYTLEVLGGPQSLLCATAGSITPGETIHGEIRGGECLLWGRMAQGWELELAEPTEVAVAVGGDADMYPEIIVVDAHGGMVADSWGSESVAVIETELGAGPYLIWVLARSSFRGAYALTVREGPAALTCPATDAITVGETVQGEITTEDCLLGYALGEAWDLELADSVDLGISVDGQVRWPNLRVMDAAGNIVADGYGDESAAALNAALGPGRYRVWVLVPWELEYQGSYTLRAWDAGSTPACEVSGSVAPGDTLQGALSSTDCTFPNGRYGDLWTLRLQNLTTVSIGLESDKIDPYLILADSAGDVIAEDDDAGAGFDAAVTLELQAGSYQVWATSYGPAEVGAYQLTVGVGAAGDAPVADLRTGPARKVSGPPAAWAPPVPLRPATPLPPLLESSHSTPEGAKAAPADRG